MPKATIRSKTGAIITIDGTKEDITQILIGLERMSAVREVKEKISGRIARKKDENKRRAASDLVIELKEEGFFNKPKALSEIATALENLGYIYPITTLSGVVLGLVQKKLLGRKKIDNKWVYGK